jgi:two-component system chemotaxis sensor kinase CheA
MIFHPGFSTAAAITNLSGRGVGMDVVKRSIEGLRGTIDIESRRRRHDDDAAHLPLTLAIIECMLVRVGDGRYAIPLPVRKNASSCPPPKWHRARGATSSTFAAIWSHLRLRDSFNTDHPADLFQKVVIVGRGAVASGWWWTRSSAAPTVIKSVQLPRRAGQPRHHSWRWHGRANP